MVNKKVAVNDRVETPNGVGFVQGYMWENGVCYILIRHKKEDLKSQDCGERLTPIEHPTSLWRYELEDIK